MSTVSGGFSVPLIDQYARRSGGAASTASASSAGPGGSTRRATRKPVQTTPRPTA